MAKLGTPMAMIDHECDSCHNRTDYVTALMHSDLLKELIVGP